MSTSTGAANGATRSTIAVLTVGLNVLAFLLLWGLHASWIGTLAGLAVLNLLLACILWFPQRMASGSSYDDRKLQNEVRTTLVQAIGGTAVLLGILFTWQQLQDNRQQFDQTNRNVASQLQLTRDGQTSERFRQAVDHLGGERTTETRIGGAVTLQQIARNDPEKYHQPAVGFLAAFVRSVSRIPPPDDWTLEGPLNVKMPEIQAAMDALSDLNDPELEQKAKADTPADLTAAYLIKAQLANSRLMGARLGGAKLQGADLTGADLRDTDLRGADLRGADLTRANLDGAVLDEALADPSTIWPADTSGSSTKATEIDLTIEERTDDPRVRQRVSLSGEYSGLPSGGSIWAFVKPHRIDRYYPQGPCQARDDGTWTCPSVALPNEHGRFLLLVVIADPEASNTIADEFLDEKLRGDFRGMVPPPGDGKPPPRNESVLPTEGLLDRAQLIISR